MYKGVVFFIQTLLFTTCAILKHGIHYVLLSLNLLGFCLFFCCCFFGGVLCVFVFFVGGGGGVHPDTAVYHMSNI